MILPIPIFYKEKIFYNVEIVEATTECIFETKKSFNNGYFRALKTFLDFCISSIDDITDKEEIHKIISYIPINTAEYLSIQVMLLQYKDDDKVEGVYSCPRCATKKICELHNEIDTRDSIKDLRVVYYGDTSKQDVLNEIEVSLSKPIDLIDKIKNVTVMNISSISIRFPTLKDYIESASLKGQNNSEDIQKEVYERCIVKINNNNVTDADKNKYIPSILKKMSLSDINTFTKCISKYGLDHHVEKICDNCGKVWNAIINTSNFFVSTLE